MPSPSRPFVLVFPYLVLFVLALLIPAPDAAAQARTQTPSEFYLQYRRTLDAARKIDEVLPFMSAETRAQVEAVSEADRAKLFDVIKTVGAMTNVRVVKEAPNGSGAILTLEGMDSRRTKTRGSVVIIKEKNAWKIGSESWKS